MKEIAYVVERHNDHYRSSKEVDRFNSCAVRCCRFVMIDRTGRDIGGYDRHGPKLGTSAGFSEREPMIGRFDLIFGGCWFSNGYFFITRWISVPAEERTSR